MLLFYITGSSVIVKADKTIRVFGRVTSEGNGLEGAEIKVKNIDRGFEISTNTDSDGYYDIFTSARDHENFKVTATFDSLEDSKTFEVISSQVEYEINFNLEDSNGNGNGNGNGEPINGTIIIEFFSSIWGWLISLSIIQLIKYLFLLLLIILIIRLLLPKRNVNNGTTTDNDTIIFLSGNGKVKRI